MSARSGMKRITMAVALVLLLGAGLIGWQVLDEPRYRGKRLSDWLGSYEFSTGTDPHEFVSSLDPYGQFEIVQDHELREAIQHIGAKAIPTLLRLVRARDSAWKMKVVGWLEDHDVMKAHYVPARSRNEAGAWGFQVLGTNAASAVPELIQTASGNGSFYSRAAAFCSLAWIGPAAKQAAPYLLQRATDTNALPGDVFSAALRRAAKDALVEIDPEAAARAGIVDPTWPERR